jgi:hypothetical protein
MSIAPGIGHVIKRGSSPDRWNDNTAITILTGIMNKFLDARRYTYINITGSVGIM